MKVELSEEDLQLLVDALESHTYWQLSDEHYRHSGYVRDPMTDDPEQLAEIKKAEALSAMFEKLIPPAITLEVKNNPHTTDPEAMCRCKHRFKRHTHAFTDACDDCGCDGFIPEHLATMAGPYGVRDFNKRGEHPQLFSDAESAYKAALLVKSTGAIICDGHVAFSVAHGEIRAGNPWSRYSQLPASEAWKELERVVMRHLR